MLISKKIGRAFSKRTKTNIDNPGPSGLPQNVSIISSPSSGPYDFEKEVSKVRQLEQSSRKLYKDMKKSTEMELQPYKQLNRIAQDLNSTSYRSPDLKGLCINFHNHASQLCDMGKDLKLAEESMLVEPMKKFHRVFPHVNAAIKKRERKSEEYEKATAKLERFNDTAQPRNDNLSRNVQITRMEFDQYDQKIAKDIPWLYAERLDYLEPCVDALIQSQLVHFSESAAIMQNLSLNLNTEQLSLPDTEYRAELDKLLATFRTLSVVGSSTASS